MTQNIPLKRKSVFYYEILPYLAILTAIFMMINGGELKEGVKYGLRLSFNNIIPTLFPFFVLSDYWSSSFIIKEEFATSKTTKRRFINPYILCSFFSGAVCGFPIGVKTAVHLYNSGVISKNELERTIGAVNNPSFAFVVFGVGAGLYDDIFLGVILYCTVILSSLILLFMFSKASSHSTKAREISRQSFNLVDSIKNAGISSITVSSYVIFFSSIIFLLRSFLPFSFLNIVLASFFEIGNAVSTIADYSGDLNVFSHIFTAFALGFSGLSVHLQAFALLPKSTNKRYYLLIKTLQGIFCSIILFIFTIIKNG